jgi:hypothetical protein
MGDEWPNIFSVTWSYISFVNISAVCSIPIAMSRLLLR